MLFTKVFVTILAPYAAFIFNLTFVSSLTAPSNSDFLDAQQKPFKNESIYETFFGRERLAKKEMSFI